MTSLLTVRASERPRIARGTLVSRLGVIGLASFAIPCAVGCRDVSRFSSNDGHYEGSVVAGSFVRAGVDDGVLYCMTLDTNHLQDGPGELSSNDGRFAHTALRPIPQVWHDPLSTMSFGDGRVQNLLYAVRPIEDAGTTSDVLAIVSLMQSGGIELRLLRGAPLAAPGSDAGASDANLFAVAALERKKGPCAF